MRIAFVTKKIQNDEKMEKDEETFGGRLTIAMGDMSVYALGEMTGLSHTVLYKYKKNVSIPAVDKADELAKALGVSFLWLAKGEGSQKPKTKNPDILAPENLKEVTVDLYTVVSAIENIAETKKTSPKELAKDVALRCMGVSNK